MTLEGLRSEIARRVPRSVPRGVAFASAYVAVFAVPAMILLVVSPLLIASRGRSASTTGTR